LLFLGLPSLMRARPESAVLYTALVAGASMALALMVAGVLGLVAGAHVSV